MRKLVISFLVMAFVIGFVGTSSTFAESHGKGRALSVEQPA
jgi:hypothetical protein